MISSVIGIVLMICCLGLLGIQITIVIHENSNSKSKDYKRKWRL
jgi:hypothetical protein